MEGERLLHDTGRVETWVCLLSTLFGSLGVFGAINAAKDSIIAAFPPGTLGIYMLTIWFWRRRFYYDQSRHQIVVRSTLVPWRPRRFSLTDAEAVYVHNVRMLTSAVTGVDIGICYQGARIKWLTRVPPDDSDSVAGTISDATALPIIQV